MTYNNRKEIEILINQIIERLSGSPDTADSSQSSLLKIGLAVWDIFSNNNTVVDSNGIELDLGSWREAAGSIANFINTKSNQDFASFDFHKGTEFASELTPADQLEQYTEIFLLFHEKGFDWKYGSEIEFDVCVTDPFPVQAYKSVFKK